MRSQGTGAEHVDLDRRDWVEDAPGRRGAAGAPQRRRGASSRASAGAAQRAPRGAAPTGGAPRRAPRPGRPSAAPPRAAAPPAAALPGPASPSAALLMLVTLPARRLRPRHGLQRLGRRRPTSSYGSSFYFFGARSLWALLGVAAMCVLSRGRLRLVPQRRACRSPGSSLAGLVARPRARHRQRHQRRPPLDHRRRPGRCSPASSPSSPPSCSSPALIAAPAARGLEARRLPAAGRHRHRAGGGAHHARARPRHDARARASPSSPCSSPAARDCATCFGWSPPAVSPSLALIAVEPYRLERLITFLDPWKDPQGSGFQATQSLISIASGRIFGVGLGNSVQKFGFLPEQTHRHDHRHHRRGARSHRPARRCWRLYAALAWVVLPHRPRTARSCSASCWRRVSRPSSSARPASTSAPPSVCCRSPACRCRWSRWAAPACVVVLAGLGILLNIATNRRSFIVVSAQRSDRAAGRGGDRRSPAAGPRRRG